MPRLVLSNGWVHQISGDREKIAKQVTRQETIHLDNGDVIFTKHVTEVKADDESA